MKIKKAIQVLYERINSMNEAQVQEEILVILDSYELQIRYGCNSQLIAFSNSIYTPTCRKNELKELQIKEQEKRMKFKKYRAAIKHEDIIKKMRANNSSYQSIADYLNRYVVHKHKFFNRKYIERFCKKNQISPQ